MLIGHLGKDGETRHTQGGVPVTNFSLATSWRTKNQQTGEWREETDWHDVVLWRSENIAPYLQKGKQVFIEGRLQTRSWEDQDGKKRYKTEVVAENLILLSSRGSDTESSPTENFTPQQSSSSGEPIANVADPIGNQGVTDDDVPF